MSNGTEQEQSAVSRIHLATMLADIAGCWLSILLAAVVAAMGMYVWVMQTYEPKYEMTASYAVVQKTYDGYMYSGYSTVSYEAATTFKYLIDSDILKEQVAEYMGVDEIDGELCLRLDKAKGTTYLSMFDMFHAWQEQAEKLKSGEITQEEYDQWRYNYPKNAK